MTNAGPLRILMVMPFWSWRFGGSVEQARLHARAFASRGHQVRVLTTDLEQDEKTERNRWLLQPEGFETFYASTTPGRERRAPYPAPRALRTALDGAVRDSDVVTTQVGLTLLNATALTACRRHGRPFVYCPQGALGAARLRQRRVAKWLFTRLIERGVLRHAAALQAVTDAEAAELRALGAAAHKIEIVPNAIDPRAVDGGDRAAARAAWGVPADATVILFLGRFAREKRVDLLVDAASRAFAAPGAERAVLVMAGPDGGTRAAVERQVAAAGLGSRARILDAQPRAKIADTLAAADVFALTSSGEGLPLGLLEAASAGLPLLLTTGCNFPEAASVGAGSIDPPEADALARSLARWIDAPESRRAAGDAGRALVASQFKIDGVADRLLKIYRSVAARS